MRSTGKTNGKVDKSPSLLHVTKRVAYYCLEQPTAASLRQILEVASADLLTHVVISSVHLEPTGTLSLYQNSHLDCLKEVASLKRIYPKLRFILSVTNECVGAARSGGSAGFPSVVSSQELRHRMARTAIEMLMRFHLDGLDIDWQFPNCGPSGLWFVGARSRAETNRERSGLTRLLTDIKSAFVENFFDRQVARQRQMNLSSSSKATSGQLNTAQLDSEPEPFLLTCTLAGQESVLGVAYELRQVASLCDWLHVLAFNYYLFKAYAPFTGPIAPLYPLVGEGIPILSKLAVSWTTGRLLELDQIEPEKLVLGVATYGRSYRLVFRQSQPNPFCLAIGSRRPAAAANNSRSSNNVNNNNNNNQNHNTRQDGKIALPEAASDQRQQSLDVGILSYAEIGELTKRPETVVEFDLRTRVPYMLADDGYTWITFENEQSVREKVRHVISNRLAGYMTYSLNLDGPSQVGNPYAGDNFNFNPNNNNLHHQLHNRDHDNRQPRLDPSTSSGRRCDQLALHEAMLDELIKLDGIADDDGDRPRGG